MQLIAELSDETFGLKSVSLPKWRVRRASRTVLLNEKGEVVLVHAQKFNYYKLPGGGIENSESLEEAVVREAMEETGYRIRIERPLGMIIEYRSRMKLLQISYCFLARAVGQPDRAKFTKKENAEKFRPILAKNLDDALRLAKKEDSLPYVAKFMVKREVLFLQKARESV
jgi:8-oxo-dGTP diphosphatase